MYHENPAVNDAVLTIVNDGDGKQCGISYADRLEAGRLDRGIYLYLAAIRAYSRYRHAHYCARHLTRDEVLEAANCLVHYYRQHLAEMA